jgi:hypothetical protein
MRAETYRLSFLLVVLSAGVLASADFVFAHRLCPQNEKCKGCGCTGGPGYRSMASRKCVGTKELTKLCGNPPTQRCTFENAPGTGQNQAFALHTHPPTVKPKKQK